MDNNTNEFQAEENTINEAGVGSQFFGTAKDVMDKYTHCALCGANLHFTHITDFARNLTHETAKCPECGVKIRQVVHRLQ